MFLRRALFRESARLFFCPAAERRFALEIFDVTLKAAYLGLTGVGMPLPVLAYLIYGSLKCGTKTGGLLFCGHLLISVLAGGVVFLGGGWIFASSGVGACLNFAAAAAAAVVGISLLVSVFRDNAFMDRELTAQAEPAFEPEYQDIYSQAGGAPAGPPARKKPQAGENIFLLGLIFTLTDVHWLSWLSVSAKSLTVQAFEAGGTGVLGLLFAVLFLVVFLLFEMILFLVLSKLISLFQGILAHWVFRILTGLCGGLLIVSAVLKGIEMVKDLGMLSF